MWNETLDNLVVVKRSGQRVNFNASKIAIAIKNAFDAVYDESDEKQVYFVFEKVLKYINNNYIDRKTINVEDIQDIIENQLKILGHDDVFKAFKEYRGRRAASRKFFNEKQQHKFIKVVEKIENENKNTEFYTTPRKLLNKFGKIIASEYSKVYILDTKYSRYFDEGILYVHDLDYFSLGYLSKVHLKFNRNEEDDFLDKIISDIINASNEISSEIGINNLDIVLERSFLNYYKNKLNETLEKYFRYAGIYELINYKKIEELIGKLNDIDIPINEFESFYFNSNIKNIFETALKDASLETKRFINITIYRIFNIIRLNNSNDNIYSISIGSKINSVCSYVRECIVNFLNDNNYLDNIHVIFKIFPDLDEDDLSKVASLVINHKNISLSFPKSSYNNGENDVEYFSDGMRIYENINDNEKRSNGRMVVVSTSINIARLGLKYINKDSTNFYDELDQLLDLAKNELLLAFETIGNKNKENYTSLFNGNVLGDERLESGQKIRKIIKSGTLNIGVVGLKECVLAYKFEANEQYQFLIEILNHLNEKIKQYSDETKLNFSLFESSSLKARKSLIGIDKSIYGVHKSITDANYYDLIGNAKFIKNYKDLANVQKLFTGGNLITIHISNENNNKKVIDLIKKLADSDIGYVHLKVGEK